MQHDGRVKRGGCLCHLIAAIVLDGWGLGVDDVGDSLLFVC